MIPTFSKAIKRTSNLFLSLAAVGLIQCAGEQTEEGGKWVALEMTDEWESKWAFAGGEWQQDAEGVMTAPENPVDENLAFFTVSAYKDFEVEFEFQWDSSFTNAGFLFHAADAQQYYLLHFPAVGQQTRAEHFWACLSRMDRTGFLKVLSMELVHGVSSHPSIWHQARLSVQGSEIQAWVDRRPLSAVIDDTYPEAGYVGLSTYSSYPRKDRRDKSRFRNLRVRGSGVEATAWDSSRQPERNWVMVDPGPTMGLGEIVRTAEGELLASSSRHQQATGANLRSADNGRTWTIGKILTDANVRWGERRTTSDGRIESYYLPPGQRPWRLFKAFSDDHGKTWSEQRQVTEITFPWDTAITAVGSSGLLELRDGTLLLFLSACTGRERKVIDGQLYYVPEPGGVVMNVSTCIRSTDAGETWSDPININGPPHGGHWMLKGLPSEISAVQTQDGSILTLVRPFRSPFMWESWSTNGGETWTPQTRGPFPMYACTRAAVSTHSGAILLGGRFPGLAVQLSRDGGMSWTCYRIDTCAWANGAMIEVEPDVVAFLYGGKGKLRGQLLKVTPDELVPLREMRSTQ